MWATGSGGILGGEDWFHFLLLMCKFSYNGALDQQTPFAVETYFRNNDCDFNTAAISSAILEQHF